MGFQGLSKGLKRPQNILLFLPLSLSLSVFYLFPPSFPHALWVWLQTTAPVKTEREKRIGSFIYPLHYMEIQEMAMILDYIPVHEPITMTENIGCYDQIHLEYISTTISLFYQWKLYENHLPLKGMNVVIGSWSGDSELTKNNKCPVHKGKLIFKVLISTN